MSSRRPVVHLRPKRDRPVRNRHPWVFSGAVARIDGDRKAPVADVVSAGGERLGTGFLSEGSRIVVRMASWQPRDLDAGFFRERLGAALALRRETVGPETTGYRLLNAEGDGLPGWTVDRFGDVLVSQVTSAGLEAVRDVAYDVLRELVPASSILQANDLPARRGESLPTDDEWIVPGERPGSAVFREEGLELTAELGGQKTGFYCDQRPQRTLAGRLAEGRDVLDLFAHTGAFACACLRGGAREVTAVESSPRFEERARDHVVRNDLDVGRLEWRTADVFAHLRETERAWDLVVADPPPLARRKAQLDRATRAYKDLNRLAISRLAPGGHLLTFSCSGAVDPTLFRQVLFAAAAEAGRELALLRPLAAGPDHPVALGHPEGEYLKGWWARAM